MQYIFTIDEKQYGFDANEMRMTDTGYAFLFDQEGQLKHIIRHWEFVTVHEPNPEVKWEQ